MERTCCVASLHGNVEIRLPLHTDTVTKHNLQCLTCSNMQVVPDVIVAFQKGLVCIKNPVRREYPVRIVVSTGDFAPSLYS